jgi:hypothetical protein
MTDFPPPLEGCKHIQLTSSFIGIKEDRCLYLVARGLVLIYYGISNPTPSLSSTGETSSITYTRFCLQKVAYAKTT